MQNEYQPHTNCGSPCPLSNINMLLCALYTAPWMLGYLRDIGALSDIAVEHASDEVDALVAESERYAQITIHDLIDAVEWILLVDDGVKQDAECPNILLFATVRFASQHFRSCIICCQLVLSMQMIQREY